MVVSQIVGRVSSRAGKRDDEGMKTLSVTLTVLVMWCVSASAGQGSPSQTKTPAQLEVKTRIPASLPGVSPQAAAQPDVEDDEDEIDVNALIEATQRDGLASIERDLDF